MKNEWSKSWNASIRPAKQRKYRYNAPLHIKHNFLAVHLSPELRKKHETRATPIRKGDKVKILVGQFKKKTGKINKVLIKNQKIYIEGIETVKKDGSKAFIPIHPSNLMITELDLADKRRKVKNEVKKEKKQEKK